MLFQTVSVLSFSACYGKITPRYFLYTFLSLESIMKPRVSLYKSATTLDPLKNLIVGRFFLPLVHKCLVLWKLTELFKGNIERG